MILLSINYRMHCTMDVKKQAIISAIMSQASICYLQWIPLLSSRALRYDRNSQFSRKLISSHVLAVAIQVMPFALILKSKRRSDERWLLWARSNLPFKRCLHVHGPISCPFSFGSESRGHWNACLCLVGRPARYWARHRNLDLMGHSSCCIVWKRCFVPTGPRE